MFIFGSSNEKSGNADSSKGIETVVGKGTALNGNIASNGDLRFDGRLDGNIETTGHVVVGATGIIIGNISAASIDIVGSVTGNISAAGNLSVHSTGQLIGDIRVKSLNIAEGGILQGHCDMDVHSSNTQT